MNSRLHLPLIIISLLVLVSACSTTKRLGPDETLYTGVNHIKINPTDDEKLPDELVANVKKAVNVPPNNPMPFMSPYVRTPFPIGLWVYNNWSDSAKGIKGWLYKELVREPVLVSDVRPDVRVKMIEQILDNNGYFGSTAAYEIDYNKKNPKKARINYTVDFSRPYRLDTIIYLEQQKPDSLHHVPLSLAHFIDSLARKSAYLQPGSVYCVDSLSDARINIVNRLRNRGYYYFRPEYIQFLADSIQNPHSIALKLALAENIPQAALLQYKTGSITTILEKQSTRNPGTPDTLYTNKGELIVMRPQRVRKNLIPSCITFREGKLFSVRDMDRTQTRLSRLGIFQAIQVQPFIANADTLNPTLDVVITCRYDRPMEASIEANVSSKSNSYIGPGLILGLTHHNIFGGAEKFSIKLNGNYEWQTGRDRSSVFNSYEFGITSSLAFPRLLAPGFIKRIRRDLNWTTITLNASILNRPHYFKMAQWNAGINYAWQSSRNVSHSFTPFKLTYTKLMSTTHDFDSIMAENPAIALSFESQFIPQLSYTYTLDKFLERERNNGINLQVSFTEAGNLFDLIWKACGVKGQKKMFGTPFSQFVKGQVQFVYSRRLIPKSEHWLVSRVLVGAEHAYGNARQVPYSEQFYIGGANSIRAFTVRSLGPGSYRAPRSQVNGYFDQTGTFKFELNTEYRFPIAGMLHGAAFIDCGNVWLLKNEEDRPGGLLQAKTFLRDLALGTGVGLRFDISMLVLRLDLGYGLHAPYDTGNGGYFNIRFKDAFALHLAIGYPF